MNTQFHKKRPDLKKKKKKTRKPGIMVHVSNPSTSENIATIGYTMNFRLSWTEIPTHPLREKENP